MLIFATMALYDIRLLKAKHLDGSVNYSLLQSMIFDDPVKAHQHYDDRIKEMPGLAAEYSCPIFIVLTRDDELHRSHTYEGENVRNWFAAYHKPGLNAIEERYYIDRIYTDIGYYVFMYREETKPTVIPVACAPTIEELQELLGENFDIYDYHP